MELPENLDLGRQWPKISTLLGLGLLWTFVPALSGEKLWDLGDAGYVPAMVLAVQHQTASEPTFHSVRYEFAVKGQSYAGEYSCKNCLLIADARTGPPIQVEYRFDDPSQNRPSGAVTASKRSAWRVLGVVGFVFLGVGLAGFWRRFRRGEE